MCGFCNGLMNNEVASSAFHLQQLNTCLFVCNRWTIQGTIKRAWCGIEQWEHGSWRRNERDEREKWEM
jgi:hypothetical protein